MTSLDTIVAIATPRGNGGIGIIRISGSRALEIAHAGNLTHRLATPVKVSFGSVTDHAIAIYFKSPQSFTGEDVVELQCHGGQVLLQKIVEALIHRGARLAQAGEFTRRALINGKLNLAGAEAIIDIIHAESDAELIATNASPELHARMCEIETQLTQISAQIEGYLDHPEDVAPPKIAPQLKSFLKTLGQFTDNAKTSNYIYNGIHVAILGKPNAGKSSLFNQILGSDRSIVTEIAGTTTDTVSETMQIDGVKVRFIDTAGICETTNKIEKLGVERSIAAAYICDIALVFDDAPLPYLKNKPVIKVSRTSKPDQIKKQIIEKTLGKNFTPRNIANTRQLNELMLAQNALRGVPPVPPPDILASCISTALYHISNITGTNATEAVLDEIFSRFCLGK